MSAALLGSAVVALSACADSLTRALGTPGAAEEDANVVRLMLLAVRGMASAV